MLIDGNVSFDLSARNASLDTEALEIIRRRIASVGGREPIIERQGTSRILVEIPGVGSVSELQDLIGSTSDLTFDAIPQAPDNMQADTNRAD
jgi:preprotein translocase subunit SecD